MKSPKKNENTTDWHDKHKFKKVLATVKINNFNRKNKIGKLKFNGINDLINNIKNNTISEADSKKKINELNEIKKVEIKGKRLINGQKTLLNLFDDLVKAILNNSNNNNNNNNNSNNSNNNNNENENENENESVNKDENENENENDNDYDDDYDSDNDDKNTVKQINNNFKKIVILSNPQIKKLKDVV